jgi:hypothetical protein
MLRSGAVKPYFQTLDFTGMFLPSLMFESKARQYPSGASYVGSVKILLTWYVK